MSMFIETQQSRSPDNRYFNDAILSWNIEARGLRGTTGIIVPGFKGEFDIPEGGELLSLVIPDYGQRIDVDVLDPEGLVVTSLVAEEDIEVFVPPGRDRLSTPLGQAAVAYLCLYPARRV